MLVQSKLVWACALLNVQIHHKLQVHSTFRRYHTSLNFKHKPTYFQSQSFPSKTVFAYVRNQEKDSKESSEYIKRK